MPVGTRFVEIPIPEGAELSRDQLELLEAALQAVLYLRYEDGGRHEALRRKLEIEGWTVETTLAWCAEARRGRDRERGIGRTRDEAFEELETLVSLDQAGEGPS
jgi:uroporphyrinogen-III synthase